MLVTVGAAAAMAKVLLRVVDLADEADMIDDSRGLWGEIRKRWQSDPTSIEKLIAGQLETKLSRHRGADSAEFIGAANDVTNLFAKLISQRRTMLCVANANESLIRYVYRNGGNSLIARTSGLATPFAEDLIRHSCETLESLIPSSQAFVPAVLQELLRETAAIPKIAESTTEILREVRKQSKATLTFSGQAILNAHASAPEAVGSVDARDWRYLGVHPSIEARAYSPSLNELPAYISRPFDLELRRLVSSSRDNNRPVMAVLVGESSTGKTRALLEAARDELPQYFILAPSSSFDLLTKMGDGVAPRTIVWLDEVQNFLTGSYSGNIIDGISALMRSDLTRSIVFLSTVWPQTLNLLMTGATSGGTQVQAEGQAGRVRQFLRLTARISVPSDFATAKLNTVERLASRDSRIREAVVIAGGPRGGLAQVLAGGRVLTDRLNEVVDVEFAAFSVGARALISAALDLRRVGHPNPLASGLVRSAARDYLPVEAYVEVSPNWVDDALLEASLPMRGVAALVPVATAPGQVTGFNAHDYLFQEYLESSRFVPTKASLWHAILDSQDDVTVNAKAAIAHDAVRRGLYECAEKLLEDSRSSAIETERLRARLQALRNGQMAATRPTKTPDSGTDPGRLASDALLSIAQREGRSEALQLLRASQFLANPNVRMGMGFDHDRAKTQLSLDVLANLDGGPDRETSRVKALLRDKDLAGLREMVGTSRVAEMAYISLLGEFDDRSEMQRLMSGGNVFARRLYIYLSKLAGDRDSLSELSQNGDRVAETALIQLLVDAGDLPTVFDLTQAGDGQAQVALSEALVKSGDLDLLRSCVHASFRSSAELLIKMTVKARRGTWQLTCEGDLEVWPQR